MQPASFVAAADGLRLAYRAQPGAVPTVVFLPGFNSDMDGSKAEHLAQWCAAVGQSYLRLDYSGHGLSEGVFAEGSIGRWCADALTVIDAVAGPRFIIVGSSMGGWIALLVALARPDRIAGVLGIAAAPDFTEHLTDRMTAQQQETLQREGVVATPSEYGSPLSISQRLIADGRTHLLLGAPIPIQAPVRLLQGQRDPDVPWQQALRIAAQITGQDVRVTLIKDGEHRLSRPSDLAAMETLLTELLASQDGA